MALKNKMDLALGIAVGSSLQIALFVAPVLYFRATRFPHRLNLEFTTPEIVAVVTAAFVTDQIAGDGESNWLEGVQLLALYVILGVLFIFCRDAVIKFVFCGWGALTRDRDRSPVLRFRVSSLELFDQTPNPKLEFQRRRRPKRVRAPPTFLTGSNYVTLISVTLGFVSVSVTVAERAFAPRRGNLMRPARGIA